MKTRNKTDRVAITPPHSGITSLFALILLFFSITAFPQSGEKWSVGCNNISGNAALGTLNAYPLYFKTNSQLWMTLSTTGMLGIGTNNPMYKLDVNGTGRFTGDLTLGSWLITNRIKSPNGTIDFDGSLLTTTQQINCKNILLSGTNNHIMATGGTVNFDGNNISTTGGITGGNLSIGNSASIYGNLAVNGTAIVNMSLSTPKLFAPSGTIDFSNNNITAAQQVSCKNVHLTGTNNHITSQSGTVSFDGNNIITTSSITGNYLNIGGNGTFGGTLTVSGNTTLNNITGHNLTLSGSSNLASLTVSGATDLNQVTGSSLAVSGSGTFNSLGVTSNLTAGGITTPQLTSNSISTGNLTVTGTLQAVNIVSSGNSNINFGGSNIATTGNITANTLIASDELVVGTNTLILSSIQGSTGVENNIYTDNGDLMVQSTDYNTNTIINNGNDGMVGIGTHAPEAKLDLDGTLRIRQGGTVNYVLTSDPDGFATWQPPVSVTGNSGISVTGNNQNFTISNTMPDQTVSMTSGGGISITGSYPSFTIANTQPNQAVTVNAGTGVDVSGNYPDFTVTNTQPDQTVAITGAGSATVTGLYPDFTVSVTDKDEQELEITGNQLSITGGNAIDLPVYTPGTGITITGNAINSVWSESGGDITLNTGGRVGIGTAPGEALDVAGNANITGTGNFGNITTGDIMVTGLAKFDNIGITNNLAVGGVITASQFTSASGSINFNDGDITTDGTVTSAAVNTTELEVTGETTTNSISSLGNLNMNGNDILNTGSIVTGSIRSTGLSGPASGIVVSDADGYLNKIEFDGNAGNVLLGDGSFGEVPGTLWQATGTHVYTNPSGNVGIGTSSPVEKLDVNGNANIRGTLYVENGVIIGQRVYSDEVDTRRLEADTMLIDKITADSLKVKGIITDSMRLEKIRLTVLLQSEKVISNNLETQTLVSDSIQTGSMITDSLTTLNVTSDKVTTKSLTSQVISTEDELGTGYRITIDGINNTITSTGPGIGFGSNNLATTGNISAGNIDATEITTDAIHATNFSLETGSFNDIEVQNSLFVAGSMRLNQAGINNYYGNLVLQSMATNSGNTIINNDNSGFVGIGTNLPQKKLHVRTYEENTGGGTGGGTDGGTGGTTGTDYESMGSVRIEHQYGTLAPSVWDLEPIINAGGARRFSIGTPDNTGMFTIKEDGNVGIGYENPERKLHVNGTGRFENVNGYIDIEFNSEHGILNSNRGILLNWYSGQDVVVGGSDDVNSGNFTSRYNTYLATQRGKVGIGTSTPLANLHIKGITDMAPGGDMSLRSAVMRIEDNVINGDADRDVSWDFTVSGNDHKFYLSSNGTGANVDALTLTEDGKVGIGTNNPGATLEVNGTLKLNLNNAVANDGDVLAYNAGNAEWKPVNTLFSEKWQEAQTAGDIHFDGNVGIGTENPIALLHLKLDQSRCVGPCPAIILEGSSSIAWKSGTSNLLPGKISFDMTTKNMDFTNNIAGNFIFYSSDPVGGNVGIGTPTPSEKLEIKDGNIYINNGVNASIYSSNHHLYFGGMPDSWGMKYYFFRPDPPCSSGQTPTYATLELQYATSATNYESRVYFTAAPGGISYIKGKLEVTEIEVKNVGSIPDYVFADDYKLSTLKEIEAYVKENHHLPEIPSAKEMEANGQNLGKMNLQLLKKIEELTLHLIEQSKQLETLKKDNEELKKAVFLEKK